MVADRLASDLGARFQSSGADEIALVARGRLDGDEVVIAKPQTWMNRSGAAAERLAEMYGAAPGDFVVAYDDVALPLGAIRVRPEGRSGGQKGMESVVRALGTERVARVRLGILGERGEADLADYVLEPFLPSEREAAEEMVGRAAEAVRILVIEGADAAMNRFNRREAAPG